MSVYNKSPNISDHEERLIHIEKLLGIVPHKPTSFETESIDTVEYNGYLIKRDLSSALYTVHDVDGLQVIPSTFNQLLKARQAVDNRVSAQKITEDRDNHAK